MEKEQARTDELHNNNKHHTAGTHKEFTKAQNYTVRNMKFQSRSW